MPHKEDSTIISGRKFTVRTLPYGVARKVYARISNILLSYADEDTRDFGPIMGAMMADALKPDDIDALIEAFGAVTTVQPNLEKDVVLVLSRKEERDAVFDGSFEDMFEWLDFAIQLTFGGVVKKLEAAKPRLEAAARKAAESTGASKA